MSDERRPMRQSMRASVLVAVIALPVVVATQSAPTGFRNERPIVTTGPGPYRLGIDVPLLVGAGDRVADLRLFDSSHREVPYLFVSPPRTEPRWSPGTILPVASTKTTSGFEVDLRQSARISAIKLGGMPIGFLKRAVIEGSGDRSRWTLLVPEGTF